MTLAMTASQSASQEKKRVALSSVAAGFFLTVFKLLIGLWTGSLGILSEAAHSGLDLVAALITYFAVRISDKPADRDHTYGHGKVENFSALVETLLLLITCGWIFYEVGRRLLTGEVEIEVNFWSFFVISTAIIIDFSRSRALMRAARKHHSQALEADALHFKTDIWSSTVVLFGLLFTTLHFPVADAISATIVAVIVVYVSVQLARRTIDALMDRVDPGLVDRIRGEVMHLEGVAGVEKIRARQSGPHIFVDMVVNVPREVPFQAADELIDVVEDRIRAVVPNSDVVVHMEPVPSRRETLVDRVLFVARDASVALVPVTGEPTHLFHARIHHVHVYRLGGPREMRPGLDGHRYHATLHVECSEDMGFAEAHLLSGNIEKKIKAEVPEIGSVSIRINKRENAVLDVTDTTASQAAMVEAIRGLMLHDPKVRRCDNILILDSGGKMHVSMTCGFDGNLDLGVLEDALTSLERSIYSSFESISDITITPVPEQR